MTPYGDFHFFLIAFIVLIPIILLGLFGKRSKIYNFISTVIMIVLIFQITNIICSTMNISVINS